MALQPCRECGHNVSTEAETCPSCGTPSPTLDAEQVSKRRSQELPAGWLLALLGFLFGIFSEFLGIALQLAAIVLAILTMARGRPLGGAVLLVFSLFLIVFLWYMAVTPIY